MLSDNEYDEAVHVSVRDISVDDLASSPGLRGGGAGEREGLVSTVCACVNVPQILADLLTHGYCQIFVL